MNATLRWLAGDPDLRKTLEPDLVDPEAAGTRYEVLRDRAARRRLARLQLADGESLLLKHYYQRGGHHPIRDGLKRRVGLDTARREWRWLSRLHAAGVPVPEPRALIELPDGDRVLAMSFLSGRPLAEALSGDRHARRNTEFFKVSTEYIRHFIFFTE